MQLPKSLLQLIEVLKRLPGVGGKSAERFAFQMISWPDEHLKEMAHVIGSIKENLNECEACGALLDAESCPFCKRTSDRLCIVGSPRDIFLIEETHEYQGHYHVMNTLLSPIDGFEPDEMDVIALKERIVRLEIEEVIIALDSTLEGDATSLYLKNELTSLKVKTSRLALGIPVGSSLDFIDGGTLARALAGRLTY